MPEENDDAVAVSFIAPAPALAPLITAYYLTEVRVGPAADVLHPEWGNLRFLIAGETPWRGANGEGELVDFPPVTLFGATSRARPVLVGAGRCLGVGMTPLGWATLVGTDAAATADAFLPADAVLGPAVVALFAALTAADGDRARADLLDAWLLERAARASPPRADIAALTRSLADPAIGSVQELAERNGLTPVTLGRACLRHFGFSSKLLLRRQRFLRTLATVLETRGRISAALDPHYVDQSHFNRDFRLFMNEAPARYFGRPHPILDAAARARRAALGASVQGLHVGG